VVSKVAALGAVVEVGVRQDGLVPVLVRVNRLVRTRLRG
jgi:transcriptional accessory protein Tex/SPT6